MRVLVVEDERLLADAIAEGLRRAGLAVDLALDGEAALEQASVNDYDVVVLDRDLPRRHGDDVCAHLVGMEPSPRVIMLTAAADLDDRVVGLELGADDYLGKPFALRELVARVRALHRRSGPAVPPVLVQGDLTLDSSRRDVTLRGRPIRLSNKEFGVLEELLRAGGAVVSAETLLEKVWDENIDPFTHVVRVTVSTLRKRLERPELIETVAGVGYRMAGETP